MFEIKISGVKNLSQILNNRMKTEKKALERAMKIEGYELKGALKKEIYEGAPGGKRFQPLSIIAAHRRTKTTVPLIRLGGLAKYRVVHDPFFDVKVGWGGLSSFGSSWKKIARQQQEGFSAPVTPRMKSFLIKEGHRFGRNRRVSGRFLRDLRHNQHLKIRPFFLRKTTTRINIPARPIIEPFWNAHKAASIRHIKENWRKKQLGLRI